MQTKKLFDILNHFKLVFAQNNYINDANYIFFNLPHKIIWCYTEDIIYFYHYDGSLVDDFGITSREIAIEVKPLFNLIKKIKKEEISISQEDNSLTIRNGRSSNTFSIPAITSDKNKLIIDRPIMQSLPENLKMIYKNYLKFDKNDDKCENIIVEDGNIISFDLYMFSKIESTFIYDFNIRWDILKHVTDNDFTSYFSDGNRIFFEKDNFVLITESTDNIFEYASYFETVENNYDASYSVFMNKKEDIDFIDTFLLDYAKKDKEIKISVNSKRILTTAEDNEKTKETIAFIRIDKYLSGESEDFIIIPEYFKMIYEKYDYFNILDGMLYAVDIENMAESICVIENL